MKFRFVRRRFNNVSVLRVYIYDGEKWSWDGYRDDGVIDCKECTLEELQAEMAEMNKSNEKTVQS